MPSCPSLTPMNTDPETQQHPSPPKTPANTCRDTNRDSSKPPLQKSQEYRIYSIKVAHQSIRANKCLQCSLLQRGIRRPKIKLQVNHTPNWTALTNCRASLTICRIIGEYRSANCISPSNVGSHMQKH